MRIMTMTVKCSDMFYCDIKDGDKYLVEGYEGYVPDFMPDEHYGDYVVLDIDLDSGRIVNWRTDSAFKSDIKRFLDKHK
jgi:hypothetical protein